MSTFSSVHCYQEAPTKTHALVHVVIDVEKVMIYVGCTAHYRVCNTDTISITISISVTIATSNGIDTCGLYSPLQTRAATAASTADPPSAKSSFATVAHGRPCHNKCCL